MMLSQLNFKDIQPFPHCGYHVDIAWKDLEGWISKHVEEDGLDLEPDFQRAHVWTEAQQIAYVEYRLRGGRTGIELLFNCPGWMGDTTHPAVAKMPNKMGPYVMVDGKQRLTAVRRFLASEIPVFGHLRKNIKGEMRLHICSFTWMVAELPTRAEVLQWYLSFNSGGTPHTPEEIARVRALLEAEKAK